MSAPLEAPAHQHVEGSGTYDHAGVCARQASRHGVGRRFAIVVARFNAALTDALYNAAVDALHQAGVTEIDAVVVPGAVEAPVLARAYARAGTYAGVIVLGCVIRGDTAHFDYVCDAVTRGCGDVALETGVPVGFGVITADTLAQAQSRAVYPPDAALGHNVGTDAALAVLETAELLDAVAASVAATT